MKIRVRYPGPEYVETVSRIPYEGEFYKNLLVYKVDKYDRPRNGEVATIYLKADDNE